jgi:hypothetical protein
MKALDWAGVGKNLASLERALERIMEQSQDSEN